MNETTNENVLRTRRKQARLPERFWGVVPEDLKRNADNRDAIDAVSEYIDRLARCDNPKDEFKGKGLLLVGPPGTGKTTLAMCIADAALRYGCRSAYVTLDQWVRFNQRAINLTTAWVKHDDQDAYAEWRQWEDFRQVVIRSRFLVLDDIGKEYSTSSGYSAGLFDAMVRGRYDVMKPTIMTSNVPVSEWDKTYSESMHSFIAEAFDAIEVSGDDRRGTR